MIVVLPRPGHNPSVVGLVGEAAVLDEAVVVGVPEARAAQQRGAERQHVGQVAARVPHGGGGRARRQARVQRRRLRLRAPVQQLEYIPHPVRPLFHNRRRLLRGRSALVRRPVDVICLPRRPRIQVVFGTLLNVVYKRHGAIPFVAERRGVPSQ